MIKMSMREYLTNMNDEFLAKYKGHNCVYFVLINDKSQLKLQFNNLPSNFTELEDDDYIIPTWINNREFKNVFLTKYPNSKVGNYIVEIDDIKYETEERFKNTLNKKSYLNIDKYTISSKQHWLNVELLKFIKNINKNSHVFTTDVAVTKKIFKDICSEDGKPIEYKKILKLFELLGISDHSFMQYVKNNK